MSKSVSQPQQAMQAMQALYRHNLRALSLWPRDALRPECQFPDTLLKRAQKTFLPQPRFSPETGEEIPAPAFNEKLEKERVNALYSLVEGRYGNKYQPGPNSTFMRPASNPNHYTDLLAELEAAPTRSTWDRVKNRLAGVFRFE